MLQFARIARPTTGYLGRVGHVGRRFISSEPETTYTKLNDPKDPARDRFFQYTWGTWIKNDKIEKARRETKFSIEGLTKVVESLKISTSADLQKPEQLTSGIVALPHNISVDTIGQSGSGVKAIASIHEGKHHRIYKLTLNSGKELVLRIPYKLDLDFAIENRIKSEVATMDFVSEKLGLRVPKVLAYGATRNNFVQRPFILMEHIEGDLLMKEWNPLAKGEDAEEKIKKVLDPIMDAQDRLLSVTFSRSGSLYFHDDVSVDNQRIAPYEESDPALSNRWRIGPSVERVFSKDKKHLSSQEVAKFTGPWDYPLDVITDVARVHQESVKSRLALTETGSRVEDIEKLKHQQAAYRDLETLSQNLIDPKSQAIMNVEEVFKPRLYVPDLDPLNVIIKDGVPVFVDFENSTIKPFVLSAYPAFIAYNGAKVYDLEEDIPGFKEMDEVEKQQYEFMFLKTRNERLWELALNAKRHDLIAVASPHLKMLKAPYLQALDIKNDDEYLFVTHAIVQLQAMWEAYVANGLANTQDAAFPVEYTAEALDKQQELLEKYQGEIVLTPFAATRGWVPQDMFQVLKDQGILVEDEEGNHNVVTEAALKDMPKEQAE